MRDHAPPNFIPETVEEYTFTCLLTFVLIPVIISLFDPRAASAGVDLLLPSRKGLHFRLLVRGQVSLLGRLPGQSSNRFSVFISKPENRP